MTPAVRNNVVLRRGIPPDLPAFVGVFDQLDNNYCVVGTKRMGANWAGPLIRIRRSADDAESDFYPDSDGWLLNSEISTFIGGGTGFVRTVYDQTANLRNFEQTTAARQPTIDISGANPVMNFALASTQRLDMVAGGLAFAQNQAAVSLVIVRKHATLATTQYVLGISNNASLARAAVASTATPLMVAQGRRLDANSAVTSTGIAGHTNWAVQIARFAYSSALLHHNVDASTETTNPFQTAGSTSNTASGSIQAGALAAGSYFDGKISVIGLVRDLITDTERDTLVASLASAKGS